MKKKEKEKLARLWFLLLWVIICTMSGFKAHMTYISINLIFYAFVCH